MTTRFAFGPFELEAANAMLTRNGQRVYLRPKAFALLEHLAANAGRLLTKQHLLDAIWPDVFVGDSVLKTNIRDVRRALDDDLETPQYIETAHRRGYRFISPVDAISTENEALASARTSIVRAPARRPIVLKRSVPDNEHGGDTDTYSLVSEERALEDIDRLLATVLHARFDSAPREAWAAHVRQQLATARGRILQVTRYSLCAAFDVPARAIRCATSLLDTVASGGCRARVGVHTGQCRPGADGLASFATLIATELSDRAEYGEILVSQTVCDLVAGSGLHFQQRESRQLRLGQEAWDLFAVRESPAPERLHVRSGRGLEAFTDAPKEDSPRACEPPFDAMAVRNRKSGTSLEEPTGRGLRKGAGPS
jgi:DNA-binding winged helix-turn-helix (wHTH) protein